MTLLTKENAEIGKQMGSHRPLITAIAATLIAVSLVAPVTVSAATHQYLAKNAPDFIADIKNEYGDIIKIAAMLQDYDENMITSVIVIESEGNVGAVSHVGAQGLMQLMPSTAKALGVTDPHDPFQNVLAGTRYLKELQTRYGFKTPQEALVAYNMGPTRAKRWLSQYDPEDYLYVQKVMYVHKVLADADRQGKTFAKNDTTVLGTGGALALASPIMTRPRTVNLSSFPAAISDRREDSVQEK